MPGFEWINELETQALLEVMNRGILFRYDMPLGRGIYVNRFEKAFAEYIGARFAIAVSSGSAAIKVALTALGVGEGDEVITQGFTFVATWEAILECRAKPVFCEIDKTLCMDPKDLERKITSKTRCIIPVHMLGAQARIIEIMAIASAKNIFVIEDTAQAVGCTLDKKYLGNFGNCGTFSFDSVKTLTTGEGGMIITDDENLYRNASEYQDHGHEHKLERANDSRRFVGFNYRMMELQGALGLVQLDKLSKMLDTQRYHKAILKEALSKVPGIIFREILDPLGDSASFLSWFMPDAIQTKRMASILAECGVLVIIWNKNIWHNFYYLEKIHNLSNIVKKGGLFKDNKSNSLYNNPFDLSYVGEILSCCLSWQIMLNWRDKEIKKYTDVIDYLISVF